MTNTFFNTKEMVRWVTLFHTFVTLINMLLNEKTVGFTYLLKYSICCTITHYVASGKLQLHIHGRWEWKRQMITLQLYKYNLTLLNHLKGLRDPPESLDHTLRIPDFKDHCPGSPKKLVRPLIGNVKSQLEDWRLWVKISFSNYFGKY